VVNAPLVVGPANNQLTDNSVAEPVGTPGNGVGADFVASAGGVVYTLSREFSGLDHTARRSEWNRSKRRPPGCWPRPPRRYDALHEAMALVRRRLAQGTLAMAEG